MRLHKTTGKQVLNVGGGARAVECIAVDGDSVAVVGRNRKLLIFPLDEIPELAKGKGVILQRYKDGELADEQKVFTLADGLSWQMGGGRTHRNRACHMARQAGGGGKLPPTGFPQPARFTDIE